MRNKDLALKDLKSNKPEDTLTPKPRLKKKVDLSINDLQNPNVKFVKASKKPRVKIEEPTVGLKEPVIVPPVNLIPNIYDRGVGRELLVGFNGEQSGFYNNMPPDCTHSLEAACRCATKTSPKYKLDIPGLI
jgi:hypothetical protein